MKHKKTIAIVFGGRSIERRISINTALDIVSAVDKIGHESYPVFLLPDGTFRVGSSALKNPDNYYSASRETKIEEKTELAHFIRKNKALYVITQNAEKEVDIVFLAVHGQNSEDGTLAGFFNTLNVPFTGSSVCASAVCMNKHFAKCIVEKSDIAVTPGLCVYRGQDYKGQAFKDALSKTFGSNIYPLFTKPMDSGSSVGIKKSKGESESEDDLLAGIDHALQFSNGVIVEKYLANRREISCAIYSGDNETYIVSNCYELSVPDTHSYIASEDKYLFNDSSRVTIEGRSKTSRAQYHNMEQNQNSECTIGDSVKQEIVEKSKIIFNILGCIGMVRIDFFLHEEKVYFNEVNPIPGSFCRNLWSEEDFNLSGSNSPPLAAFVLK